MFLDKWNGILAVDKPKGAKSGDIVNFLRHSMTASRYLDSGVSSGDKQGKQLKSWVRNFPKLEQIDLSYCEPESKSTANRKRFIKWPFKDIKVGHGGTLDPLASGVLGLLGLDFLLLLLLTLLVLGLNKGTKDLEPFLSSKFGCRKVYEVEACLGLQSDTYDSTGVITPMNTIEKCFSISKKTLCDAIESLFGECFMSYEQAISTKDLKPHEILQKPPAFSALRVQGKRLYDLARDQRKDSDKSSVDAILETKKRPVTIFSISLVSFDEAHNDLSTISSNCQISQLNQQELVKILPKFKLRIECGGGTYIRSIIHDIGQALESGALMTQLRRTKQGCFCVQEEPDSIKTVSLSSFTQLESIESIWNEIQRSGKLSQEYISNELRRDKHAMNDAFAVKRECGNVSSEMSMKKPRLNR